MSNLGVDRDATSLEHPLNIRVPHRYEIAFTAVWSSEFFCALFGIEHQAERLQFFNFLVYLHEEFGSRYPTVRAAARCGMSGACCVTS